MQPSMANLPSMNNIAQINIDSIIQRLLAVKGTRPMQNANLTQQQIAGMLITAQSVFMSQPMLLSLKAPVKICGDIHGQYRDLLRIFDLCGYPPHSNYLFLGDYVDRGKQGIQTFCLLLALKLKYPQNFFMLRGNHQSEQITRVYGFFDECKRRYSVQLWKMFTELFKLLPVSAIIDDKILCMHGGLSPQLSNIEDINKIPRPAIVPPKGLLCDILWSDPKANVNGWGQNDRGISFTFGENLVQFMIQKFKLELICRAHQVVQDGYQFFAKRRLVTVFSAPNYMGDFDNSGGIMNVGQDLMCNFRVLKPAQIQATAITASGRRGSPPAPKN